MGLFSKILSKLGLKKPEEKAQAPSAATMKKKDEEPVVGPGKPTGRPMPSGRPGSYTPVPRPAPAGEAKPAPMEMVDVMGKLETMAKGTSLDWKVSIVDLLKVLDIDSSLQARKELAEELGAPADVMADNVRMNVWLHKTVLAKIAENGGNIPKELLD